MYSSFYLDYIQLAVRIQTVLVLQVCKYLLIYDDLGPYCVL